MAVIIPFEVLHAAPWRNGGGRTVEIASGPAGSNGAWSWRISVASIDAAGPFSAFPGLGRILTLVEGDRMDLAIDGETHRVTKWTCT